jgi:putative membrane protein
MKNHALFFMMTGGFLSSCAREGGFGPQGSDGWGPMMHYGFGYGGMFMWIIFLIVIGLLIYFMVQALKTKGRAPTQDESPLDILRRRYAKGEIAREEFERMKKDIEG